MKSLSIRERSTAWEFNFHDEWNYLHAHLLHIIVLDGVLWTE